jgi:hypothetical protein
VFNGTSLGIGVSPSSILDVSSAATVLRLTSKTGTKSVYQRISNAGGQLYFGIDNSAGNDLASGSTAYAGVIVAPGTTRNLHLGTNGTVRMTIDSSGYVTFPYQVAIEVNRQANFSVVSNDNIGTVVPFNSKTLDVGSNFSTSTYRFTAPVAGKYEFHWSYGCNTASNTVYRTYLWINGSRQNNSQLRNDNSKTGSAYSWGSRALILSLNANDYVELRASSDNATDFYADTYLQISMGISLIS